MYRSLLILLSLFAIACNGVVNSADSTNEEDLAALNELNASRLTGTWKVITYVDLETGRTIAPTQKNSWGLDVVITFEERDSLHRFDGHNTSNSIQGTFKYTAQDSIDVPGYISTYIANPEWGRLFDANFHGKMHYRILGDQLIVTNNPDLHHAIVFKRR